MAINWTEAQIEQIVASVMKGLKGEASAPKGEYNGAGYNGKKYIGVYDDMKDAIDAAEMGYKAIRAMSLEEREKIVKPIEELFLEAPGVILPDFYARLCRSGCEIYQKKIKTDYPVDEFIRICDKDGFFALGQVKEYPDGPAIKALKLFKL